MEAKLVPFSLGCKMGEERVHQLRQTLSDGQCSPSLSNADHVRSVPPVSVPRQAQRLRCLVCNSLAEALSFLQMLILDLFPLCPSNTV